ncbi:hypothetical protein [Haliscomenobacter hydrossis]|uniref:Glycosyl-4,4'-diaponeurosporenoate acyltransferase n=1 Tax=Haliscomenobacter hydrossis (strain ATCC 27775 / DSM 1100 / LMG 10767 / O) TaxID=760192 RepID=F4L1P0_HALH1|nr:hypothetical protein Halhy_0676 [Haliscomenobacter hydrossis DSM 1100]
MVNYIIFGVSISVISWMVGIIFNSILVKTKYYERLSHMNFIDSKILNKYLGLKYFKWIVKNTFFKYFNQKIQLRNGKADLAEVRKEMTYAETSHLIGFIFVGVFAIYWSVTRSFLFGFIIMIANTLMNLYPSLLQQENKRRIDKLIKNQ